MSEDRDWRLHVETGGGLEEHQVDELLARARRHAAGEGGVEADVVVTHDGSAFFAYAAARAPLLAISEALGRELGEHGREGRVTVSHWDDERDRWRQVEPPLDAAQAQVQERADRAAEETETRTLVASAGRLVRGEFESTMLAWAGQLGLRCEIFEHRHLLSTQVAFTVTGPRGKVDEFARGLAAEGWTMLRTESTVMLNPL